MTQIGADIMLQPQVPCLLDIHGQSIALDAGTLVWVPSRVRFRCRQQNDSGSVRELRIRRSAFAPNCAIDQEARDAINATCDWARQRSYQIMPKRRRQTLRLFNACFSTTSNLQLKGLVCQLLDELSQGLSAPETKLAGSHGNRPHQGFCSIIYARIIMKK